ncbi:hypothetical protein [Halobaculum rubrum]|uniref:hypothetical protein n=1 Tax=Halobaculum rubrum TaxID=2872158 RepID=UPI001CA3DDE8|nr:hypothetical protein K6T25_03065 [Halobaculum rubrum]
MTAGTVDEYISTGGWKYLSYGGCIRQNAHVRPSDTTRVGRAVTGLRPDPTAKEPVSAGHDRVDERTGPDGARLDPETVHRTVLAHLRGEFATLSTTDELLASLGGAE